MTHFLHLHEWLNAGEAVSYLKINDIDVSLHKLLKIYAALDFELQLDFKDPSMYVMEVKEGEPYPYSLSLNDYVDRSKLIHKSGQLSRLFHPVKISINVLQRGYSANEVVWIDQSLQGELHGRENFKTIPVYLLWFDQSTIDEIHDFEMLTWGIVLNNLPSLLLFKKDSLDTIIRNEKNSSSKVQISKMKMEKINTMGSKERNTLLILIAALCQEAKVDYKKRGVAIAIQKMTENIGAPVTDDTIKGVLDQIQSALDSRGK